MKPIKIAGREVLISWNQEAARRFDFRMGQIGGEPSPSKLANPKTVTTSLFQILWGLLPPIDHKLYDSPEELYAAVDHESEAKGIYEAIKAIYEERFPSAEKKSDLKKSPLPESNSD